MISLIITHIYSGSSVTVSQLSKEISLLDSMHMLKSGWQNVRQDSVVVLPKLGLSHNVQQWKKKLTLHQLV